MIESAFFLVEVESKKQGIRRTKLDKLFYGDGKIEVAGSAKGRLIDWEVVDSEKEMDSWSFSVENSDFSLIDSPLLAKGNIVFLQYGYPGNMSKTFKGVINGRSGWRVLTIQGSFDSEIVIANNQATEKFLNKKLSDVAKELFLREGLKAQVDDTKIVLPVVIKRDETTLQFLKRKAKDAGGAYEVYVEGDTGFFVKKKFADQPILTLRWGTEKQESDYKTIDEPRFEDIQQNTATKETFKGFDLLEKKPINESADNKTSTQTALGQGTYYFDDAAGTRKFRPERAGASEETGRSRPTQKQKPNEASAQASSAFDSKNAKAFQLSWKIEGDPTIRAKTVVFVDVPSKSISGRWYIEEARHGSSIGNYVTTLKMIRNALGKAVGTDAATPLGGENVKAPNDKAKGKVSYVFDEQKGTRVPKVGA